MKSLKQLKEERAMTYQQISDRSGVPVSTIHRVIDGQAKNPGYDTVTAIRDALGGAPDEEPPPEIDCNACSRDMPTRQDYVQMSASYQQIDTGVKDRLANSGHVGIHKCSRSGGYQVRMGNRYVSLVHSLEEAVAVREEAERRHKAGTLDAYIQELRRERSLKK